MTSFSVDLGDYKRFSKDVSSMAAQVEIHGQIAVGLAGGAYKNDVQEVIAYKSGTLRKSVHVEPNTENGSPIALVGSDVKYARRIEYGFVGYDSLGRFYQQMPRPSWRPMFDINLSKYARIMEEEMAKVEMKA